MSNTLYNEAIEAAEQIKLAAEEKVKQQIVESISPQIKSLVEKKLFESNEEECGYERIDEEEREYEGLDKEEKEEGVELNQESRRILNKLISSSAKKDAAYQKIEDLRESINSLQKAIILSENSNQYSSTKSKVVILYKNLVNEISKLKTNSIIRSDKELLREFYKLNKELENMSRRRSNRKYLNESLEDLLEMDLFEAEGDEDDDDMPKDDDMDLGMEDENPEDVDTMDDEGEMPEDSDSSDSVDIDDLKAMTVEELGDLVSGESEDSDDEDEPELDLEGLFEMDEMEEMYEEDDDDDDKDKKETLRAGGMEESRRRDRVLEIDENMLRREIGRMKSLREGEAKDMAHHFGGGSIEGEVFVDGVELNKLHEMKIKAAKVIRKNRMLESKLTQHKKALRAMKSQLTEMNLFNAKLLYANKLMQNRDLSMKQQRHIVESLDEAKTLGEAKILFESLSKSLVSSRRTSTGNLTEGATRRPMSSSSRPVRSAQAKPMNESVALDRWATLAGIK
jgi:hypothetical protein